MVVVTHGYHEQRNYVEDAKVDQIEQLRVVQLAIDYANRFYATVAEVIVDRVHENEFRHRVQCRGNPHAHYDHLGGGSWERQFKRN